MKKILSTISFKPVLFFALASILTFTSCVKEESITTLTTITSDPKQIITTTLHGRVVDENNAAIAGATVIYKSGNTPQTVETDEKGYYFFQDVRNKGNSAFLTVQHHGKFEAFRRMSVIPNRYNYTEIKMNDKTIIGQVSASTGGTLTHESGAKVTLPAQGIVDNNGNDYAGSVNVAMAWIDPSANDLAARMVGDLSGIDEEGQERSLGTFGMLQVELLDASGDELNITQGSEAQLVFPVPVSMQSNAPQTIPLWSYDEELGTWIQEGEATYTDGEYIGKVTHFSSWNVDWMTDPIEISGVVQWESDGNFIGGSYWQIYVTSEIIGQKGGWLCDNGEFLFYNFPKNEEFILKILNPCGEIVYQETYGPYTENTDLGTIEVISDTDLLSVFGNAVDCDNNPVTEGYISVDYNERRVNFPIDAEGNFTFSLTYCELVSGELHVVNTAEQLISNAFAFDGSQTSWTFTDISVCDELMDYLQISVDTFAAVIYTPGINFASADSITFISYGYESQNEYVYISIFFDPPTALNITAPINDISYYQSDNTQNYFYYYLSSGDEILITFTEYDNVPGGAVEGSFTGTATNEFTGASVPISGSFHVPIE